MEEDKKISALSMLSTITGNEIIPVSTNGMNYGLPVSKLAKAEELEGLSEKFQPKGDYLTKETDPTVPSWAKKSEKPSYTAEEVGALPEDTSFKTINGISILGDGDISFEEMVSYGIEYDITVSYPDCLRIGSPVLHRTLPIHNRIKGCLLDDNGEVVKYLNPTDWTEEVRDGSYGQVMVELPIYYRKFETEGNKRRVRLSEYPLPGYHQVKKKYVSAYEATVQRSTTTLCSVVNTDADYRGGNNNAEWDGTYRTLTGRPATQISRTNFRNYARKRKSSTKEWNCMTYDIQKDIYWLFVVEFATRNSQKAFNAALTAEGYKQGGLGDGVTTLNGSKWSTFNGSNPIIPCGYTDELGNGTGEVEYTMPEEYDSATTTVKVPRYRGIENPFGHIWQWTDGINVRISPNSPTGDGLSKVFVTDNPEYFNDSNYNNMQHVGNEARTESYVKEVIFGEGGEIMPSVVGGGSTTYFCDYHYTNIPTSEQLRGVRFGGSAYYGSAAGLVSANSNNAPSNANANIGSHLYFSVKDITLMDNNPATWQKTYIQKRCW